MKKFKALIRSEFAFLSFATVVFTVYVVDFGSLPSSYAAVVTDISGSDVRSIAAVTTHTVIRRNRLNFVLICHSSLLNMIC